MRLAFISYSSTDREFVTKFAEALKQAHCEVWFDRWNITGREPYWDEIQAGVEGCSHFVFVISPDSISSTSGARKELYHASGLKSPPTIIPIMGRETHFRQAAYPDLAGRIPDPRLVHQPFNVTFQQVLNAIQAQPTDTVGRRAALEHITSALPAVKVTAPVAPSQVAPTRKAPAGRRLLFAAAILLVLIAVGFVLINGNQPPASLADARTESASSLGTAVSTQAVTSTPVPTAAATEVALANVPAEVVPSATPTGTFDISLIYDSTQFVVLNVGKRSVNITQLDFVQNGKATRTLGTTQWHQSNAPFPPESMPPSACFQVARSGQALPDPLKACRPRTWTQIGSSRWFWIAQDDFVSTFEVHLGSQTIQTCQIKEGQCNVSLP